MKTNNKVKDQVITENYALYNSDNMLVMPTIGNETVGLSVYSPPFSTRTGGALYNYSSSPNDLSNCDSSEQFMEQYEFLIKEISRVTQKGRISAVHCTEVIDNDGSSWDFPHEIIELHIRNGFEYKGRITIWKEPLKVRMRTMVQSLMHKFIVEDSTKCYVSQPDYVLIFKKKGENAIPVTHPCGLNHYAGEVPILPNMLRAWNNANDSKLNEDQLWEYLKYKYEDHQDPKSNKLSHYIWQRYASSVWDDIRIDNVLPFRDGKDPDDEKHVHPLQLDVIDRIVELYSNPGEVVLTPFMGVGSEVFSPVSLGRKAIGIELKDSYYKQAKINLSLADKRFSNEIKKQDKLF